MVTLRMVLPAVDVLNLRMFAPLSLLLSPIDARPRPQLALRLPHGLFIFRRAGELVPIPSPDHCQRTVCCHLHAATIGALGYERRETVGAETAQHTGAASEQRQKDVRQAARMGGTEVSGAFQGTGSRLVVVRHASPSTGDPEGHRDLDE